MKHLLLLLFSFIISVGLSFPAYADLSDADGKDNAAAIATDNLFLEKLKSAGFNYSNSNDAIMSAQMICVLATIGRPGLDIIYDLKRANPGLTTDRAIEFTRITTETYCKQHLERRQ